MSLAELRAFNAIARCNSVVKAAEMLGRSQPTLTMQLSQLEQAYNAELVIRNRGRLVGLTPFGESLYAITKQMFALENDAVELLRSCGKLTTGGIRVGAVGPGTSIRILGEFSRRHPEVDVSVRFGNSAHVQHLVQDCQVDVGIIGGLGTAPGCFGFPISKPEVLLLAHEDHPAARSATIGRTAFAGETLLLREEGSETRSLVTEQMKLHNYLPARTVEIGSGSALLDAALERLGLAPVSEEGLNLASSLRVIRFADFRIHGAMSIVCLTSRAKTPLIAAMLDAASAIAQK